MYAIAEFGSTSRCTADKYSDRDLLVVCKKEFQSILYGRYSNNGYSVSLLTPEQLYYMKKRGALFIQHLKIEAKILVDADGQLARFLNSCELEPPTAKELRRCEDTVEFIGSWSNNVELSAWKADFLYCVSRDLLIKTLATRGVVAFGLEDIEREVRHHYGVTRREFANLYKLREIKSAYRSNNRLPTGIVGTANDWLETLNRTFDVSAVDTAMESIDSKVEYLKVRQFNSPYERLRSLEAVYLLARSNNLWHSEHVLLMKYVLSPNRYGSSQICKSLQINNYLCDVIDLLGDNTIRQTNYSLRFNSLQVGS